MIHALGQVALDNSITNVISTNKRKEANFDDVLARTNVEINTTNFASSDIYGELSKNYNVRNATFDEIVQIANALYEAGEISGKEVALMTFDFDRAKRDLIHNAGHIIRENGIQISSDFSLYETSANELGQRDWIAEFEARASKSFKYGDLISYQNNNKIVSILQKLQPNESTFDEAYLTSIPVEEAQKLAEQQANGKVKKSLFPEDAPQAVHDYYNSLTLKEKGSLFIKVATEKIKANAYLNQQGQWCIVRPDEPNYVDIFTVPGFTYTKLADAMLHDLEFQKKFIDGAKYKEELEMLEKFKQAVNGY
ncbi:hypothetical protein SAMN05880501_104309 [Ureibacillus xyleni]|uniref:Uncharacterized protein n=1 Tax=Ureibacillus xyleni TaxID=614648 RepID=A0A285SKQ3_9BACL|nr:hypothetical protein [Ureibacillus xyleni]SOC06558.1 hypothetical protein SAMN05880501_104309 [Ureibacillus xyleni]